MKKFLILFLLFISTLTLTACSSSNNSMARNMETNVNRLSSMLKQSSNISSDEIIIKELYNSDNYVTPTNNNFNYKKIVSRENFNPNKNNIVKINNIPKPNGEILEDYKIKRLTNSTYTPRRILSDENNNLMNYLSKIEDLYLIMNDAACANEDCNNLKSDIISYCQIITSLSKEINNKNIVLDDKQVSACNDLIGQLNKDLNSLNNSKNDIKNNCSACKTTNLNPNVNIEQVSAKYIKLINSLEQRATIYNNILNILRQLDCTITGKCNNCVNNDCEEEIKTPIIKNMPAEVKINNKVVDVKEEKTDKKIKNIDTFKINENKKENLNKNNTNQNEFNEESIETSENPAVGYIPNGYGYNYPAGGMMPNGMYGNYGYGIHSIENGITNPYRNTDTYKLPTINEVRRGYNYNGIAFINPLKEETRKDFKVFA